MINQITRTKIIAPRRRLDLLSRERLLNILYELLDFRLIIVIAPAGYGKTFLLVDFAYRTEFPVCWFALDTLDRDSHRFFLHFIAAITEKFPSFGKASVAALQNMANGQGTVDQLITTVVNELYEHVREHFVFVIDDFYLVDDNPEISRFVSQFIQKVDENCHLVVASRRLLTIPDMALMVARGYVGGIDFEDLAFEADELQQLTQQNFGQAMPDAEASTLVEATDGWIIGLLLSTQSKLHSISGRMRLMRTSGIDLYDYLAQQVLNQQPQTIREFLLRTCLLEEFDANLCNQVFSNRWVSPPGSWQSLIDEVLRRNLFVLPVGENGAWLRYNHVFHDFLQKQIAAERPEEERFILERLVQIYREEEAWEKAHYFLKRLGAPVAVADLIEECGIGLLDNGRISLLDTWIRELPPALVEQRARLLMISGLLASRQGNMNYSLQCLTTAEQIQRAHQDSVMLAHILARRSIIHRLMGGYQESIRDAETALELVQQPVVQTRSTLYVTALAQYSKGFTVNLMGKPKEGLPWLERALLIYQKFDDTHKVAAVLMDLATLYLTMGRFQEALPHFRHTLEVWRKLENLAELANVLNNLGYVYHLLGKYEEGLSYLEQAADCAQRSGYLRILAYARTSMGDLFIDLELWEAANKIYAEASPIAAQTGERFLILYLHLALARLASLRHQWDGVFLHLDRASRFVLSKESGYEWGLYQLTVGRCKLGQAKTQEAIEPLQDALQHFHAGAQRTEEATAHFLLTFAWQTLDNQERAAHHLNQAIDLLARLESAYPLLPLLRTYPLRYPQTDLVENPRRLRQLQGEIEAFDHALPGLHKHLRRHASSEIGKLLTKPAPLIIRTLGRTEVSVDGKVIAHSDWQTLVSRDLFLYLLAHPNGQRKEEIGLLFWPDASPAVLKTRFKNAIYRLRNALQCEAILFSNELYTFNRATDYDYDVENFLARISEATQSRTPQGRIELYSKALACYGGDYLPDLDWGWVSTERERLKRVFAESALKLAELQYENGNPHSALETVQRLLADDPCQEEAHRFAMQVYAALGNRAAIARQYVLCQQALKNEVDAPPSPQTADLYQTLMRSEMHSQ